MDDLLRGPLGDERRRPDEAVAIARALALLTLLLLFTGCGSDEPRGEVGSSPPAPGEAGGLAYALPASPAGMDPLTAPDLGAAIVSRQVHEPLVARVSGPYGGPRRTAGLATALRPSPDRTVWTVQLRRGVSFQDGTPFDAAAVLVNSRRWNSTPSGRAVLPELFAVDAPRPGEVRFLLERPVGDLPSHLADPRLGIVSPLALEPQSGEGARFRVGARGTGTGAFALTEAAPRADALVRNPGWWGTPLGLGPALESVRFVSPRSPARRAERLRDGAVQIAGPLPAAVLAALRADPLLSAVPGTGGGVGISASVRGLAPAQRLPLLSGVWLTTLTG
jgi:peptide/nickel transport system substrate-binding protein